MPTITQLPTVTRVTAADQVPLSQAGITHSVSVGTLLAALQPAITADTGTLLGRTSLGSGGPEPIHVGTGLTLNDATLAATGLDHAAFATQPTLSASDQIVLSSSGEPRLLQLSLIRGLFSAGSNISISATGTISSSATQSADIAALPAASVLSSQDLIAVSQAGVDHAISYGALLDGQTIDMAQPAAAAQDSDEFWVAQGSNAMLRQSLSAVWLWFAAKLPSIKQPVVELTTDTALDTTVHNGRILVCSLPISLQAVSLNMGSGFACEVLNLSNGAVSLQGDFVTSSSTPMIPPGQTAAIRCIAYSGGTVVYAGLSNVGGAVAPPGAVSGLTVSGVTQSAIDLTWLPVSSATSYVVQYRPAGSTNWLLACSGLTTTTYSVAGLLPSTAYDLNVLAVNNAGTGTSPASTTATTAAPVASPGQITDLTTGAITSNSVTLNWSAPSTGGPAISYSVQFRVSGALDWTTAISGLAGTLYSVASLVPGTSYEFQVFASNSAGNGPSSAAVSAGTSPVAGSVTAIAWNAVPSGSYAHGAGSIGVNVHVTPGTAAVQFGVSPSTSTLPSSWVAGTYVNTDLWGAYVATPAAAGTWYVWATGTDGSCPTVYPTSFKVT